MRLALVTVLVTLVLPAAAPAQVAVPPLLVPERPPPSEAEEEPRPEPDPEPGPGPAAEPQAEPAKPPAPSRRTLSDERRRSTWAYVLRRAVARSAPRAGGRAVHRLGLVTPDGTAEVVLALEERRLRDGATWVRVRLPMRPNNTTGWVRRRALGRYRLVRTFLRVDRRRLTATLYRRGRVVWHAPVGVGESRWPTPRGRFYVRERLIPTDPDGLYGVFAFGLSAYSETLTDWPGGGMIGIHGTNQPELLPGRVSHGCVRVANARIARLRRLMGLGTPVRVV